MNYLARKIYNRWKKMSFNAYIFLFILYCSPDIYASVDQRTSVIAGATLNINFSAYTHQDRGTIFSVMPAIFYDNAKLYIESDEVGIYLYRDDQNELRLNSYYDSSEFDPAYHDRGLNKRKWSVMAGASYMKITPYGGLKLQIGSDILKRNHGTVITASYLAELQQGRWTWYPEFGINWNNAAYNRYYYGITSAEAKQTGLMAYQPKSAVEPYLSVNNVYRINDQFDLTSGIEIHYMTDELYSSPLVNRHFDITALIGFLYHF